MIGVMISTCARIIPRMVKSIFSRPKGPRLMTSIYTTRPITTGGTPISVRLMRITILFPGNRACSNKSPEKIPSMEEIKVAPSANWKVTQMASNTPTSEKKVSSKFFIDCIVVTCQKRGCLSNPHFSPYSLAFGVNNASPY